MSETESSWRTLHTCTDALRARVVATCLQSMKFDARVRAQGRVWDCAESEPPPAGPYTIEVHDEHVVELRNALADLLAEQDEFDASLQLRHRTQRFVFQFVCIAAVTAFIAYLIWRATQPASVSPP